MAPYPKFWLLLPSGIVAWLRRRQRLAAFCEVIASSTAAAASKPNYDPDSFDRWPGWGEEVTLLEFDGCLTQSSLTNISNVVSKLDLAGASQFVTMLLPGVCVLDFLIAMRWGYQSRSALKARSRGHQRQPGPGQYRRAEAEELYKTRALGAARGWNRGGAGGGRRRRGADG